MIEFVLVWFGSNFNVFDSASWLVKDESLAPIFSLNVASPSPFAHEYASVSEDKKHRADFRRNVNCSFLITFDNSADDQKNTPFL